MTLPEGDHQLVVEGLDREPTQTEAALFENLWSEHCAYRSSRPLLGAFESDADHVVVGPGDDAAAISLDEETIAVLGVESHNHPSYVEPYDGAATGVGGIVRDVMSMGAYPIALVDSLYFGPFDHDHSRYLLEGVVDGIADYGNAIGVPTVGGSLSFHSGYQGNPLVNVGCVGLTTPDRLLRGAAQASGNHLVLVGNATGRDGLGGASFASEDLDEDSAVEDRPAVQVGDPYTEKLLIEANEALLDRDLIQSARDLGAAGLGGATSELVAQGGLGAMIDLDQVHQREPNMNATEILLAESQERMAYEVEPGDVEEVLAVAAEFDLEASVIGEISDGNYVCRFDGEVVVDVPPALVAEGAPMEDRVGSTTSEPIVERPSVSLDDAVESVLTSPNIGSRRWVYRQYDHEVGTRTALRPGDDAAVMAIREADSGLALVSGAEPNWTAASPRRGGAAVGLEQATNLAIKGARPLAAVDCLNGGNPEKPDVFGGFRAIVDGLADVCSTLEIPIVGGNVSLYNDSDHGPIPPTPTVFMIGQTPSVDVPTLLARGDTVLVLIGDPVAIGADGRLGGSELFARFDATGRFPELPEHPQTSIETLIDIARHDATVATHDVAHGGLLTALAEMVSPSVGLSIEYEGNGDALESAFHEQPGRALVQTTDLDALEAVIDDRVPMTHLGTGDASGRLHGTIAGASIDLAFEQIDAWRSTIETALE